MQSKVENYTKSDAVFEDGDWWYKSPSGYRQRVSTHAAKNTNRMFVNGQYIPSSHPLHKAGRYKSFDDVWSHNQIDKTSEGEVYAIVNPAWPDWVKVGKAVSSEDRLNGYQTSSPYRDYTVITTVSVDNRHEEERRMHKVLTAHATERKGEWFKISVNTVKEIFEKGD